MSRLEQGTITERITSKYLEYKTLKKKVVADGEEFEKVVGGEWVFWDYNMPDDDAPEGKNGKPDKNVHIKLPFRFCVLQANTKSYKGYDETRKRTVYSNEYIDPKGTTVYIKDRKTHDILHTFQADQWNPKDKSIKPQKPIVEGLGAKYTQSVYCAIQNEAGEFEIVNLQLKGGSLTGAVQLVNGRPANKDEANDGWFAFTRQAGKSLYTHWIEVNSFKAKTKGKNKFTVPVYTLGEPIDSDDLPVLEDLYQRVQDHLTVYLKEDHSIKKDTRDDQKPVEVDAEDAADEPADY